MSALDTAVAHLGDASRLAAFEQMMDNAAASGSRKLEVDFAEAYEAIERSLCRKLPQKTMIEKFNEAFGHKLYAPRFRKLLTDERKRRKEGGNELSCKECGQSLLKATDAALLQEAEDGERREG
jgi:hypothetical protein